MTCLDSDAEITTSKSLRGSCSPHDDDAEHGAAGENSERLSAAFALERGANQSDR